MKISSQAQNVLMIGAAGVAVYFVATRAVGADISRTASAVGTAFNPVDEGNLVNRGVNGIINGIRRAGGATSDTSLGSLIFDLFNPGFDPNERSVAESPRNAVARREPNVFLLDPFGPSVEQQLANIGIGI